MRYSVQFSHPAYYGEQKRHLHRETITPIVATVEKNFATDYSAERGMDDHNYITDDDFLRDLRDYTSVLEPLPGASAEHIAVSRLSDNPMMADLWERISEITRTD